MVFVTGDTHGDIKRFSGSKLKGLTKNDTIIVCGDFGFIWDDSKTEQRNLKKLAKKKYTICFIDGTHENFDRLMSYKECEFKGGRAHKIADNIYHLMRGQVYTIEGRRIFTMGGGESPDIDYRYEQNTWSKYEIPSKDELREGAENLEKADCNVDVIITHEPPLKIKSFLNLQDEAESLKVSGLNTYFQELGQACKFDKWFFGSMHMDKFISNTYIAVFNNVINIRTGDILE